MKDDSKLGYMLIFPGLLILCTLVFYPIILTFIYSLQYYKLTRLNDRKYIGLENYKKVFLDGDFHQAFINTLIIILVVVIVGLIGSFIMALMLNRKSKISGILTAIGIIPWALPPVVNGLIWKFIFYPEVGFLNKIFYKFHWINGSLNWINNTYGSLIIIGLIVAWRVIPFSGIVLLANIQAIPESVYEAAKIDGAGSLNQFRYITLPLLYPTLGIIVCNFILNGINVFDEMVSLVGYRTLGESLTMYNYNETFSFLNIGFGSSITYIIMIISGIFGFIYIKSLERKI
ncbi:carbohydrate ABC transporter membrane protein 1, CUT1 family (TC 3.A.1.1.-) [Cetobacterium ceti]|uniref:Carbohydrate ABC transporter membrane protein 1, CUT1 family (TC 3.A.1.1.-) n=1 Tax=Cetobacterium ceti TaxID=180163 RepID=A0A1T4NKI3_9FUSO|nr:sugar ABC transporter permease [Cetobacterium ceti]SJZ79527.1 carbohydrate ABC transporter membrane protein 1, CUT1 family (TC 3.A.1.1.-) [Cetobacterium ceti]